MTSELPNRRLKYEKNKRNNTVYSNINAAYYTLYVYDKENDTYSAVSYVDAYDRALYEDNKEGLANRPFPYDIDKDNNGFVYYILNYEDGLNQEIQAVDDDAYQTWLNQYTEGTEKTDIKFYKVTAENINLILNNK